MPLSPQAAALLGRLELHGVRLGLGTTRRLLTALGEPQRRVPAVLVAGTNGKGSTATFLAGMATAAGYRTGLYTSPHLEEVEERIRVDGRAVDGAVLSERLARLVEVGCADLGYLPTYFEALTAVAFDHFADEAVDLAVLEVGMGGRLDATNAAESVLALVSQIGRDHREYLGPTLPAIAREKAGIFRRGRPAIAWSGRRRVRRALAAAAEEVGADLVFGPDAAKVTWRRSRGLDGQRLGLRTGAAEYRLQTALAGDHQVANLALAVLGAEVLARQGWPAIDGEAIARGAAASRWPGRLEAVARPDGGTVLLDAAHNPDGARVLSRFLAGLGTPFDLLFGALSDKEVARLLPPLAGPARRVVLTAPASDRATPPEKLAALLPGRRPVIAPNAESALDALLAGAPELAVVCGSIYLVGEVRTLLRRRWGRPPPAAGTSLYDSGS